MQVKNDGLFIKGVYYLSSKNENMNPIAICLMIIHNRVEWQDTNTGRSIKYKKILLDKKDITNDLKETIQPGKNETPIPDTIEIESENNESFTFKKLTLEYFNKFLKNKVASGETLNFKNDNELQNYYINF